MNLMLVNVIEETVDSETPGEPVLGFVSLVALPDVSHRHVVCPLAEVNLLHLLSFQTGHGVAESFLQDGEATVGETVYKRGAVGALPEQVVLWSVASCHLAYLHIGFSVMVHTFSHATLARCFLPSPQQNKIHHFVHELCSCQAVFSVHFRSTNGRSEIFHSQTKRDENKA